MIRSSGRRRSSLCPCVLIFYSVLHALIPFPPIFLTHNSCRVQAFVGSMIKNQPLFIKGIDMSNQERTKESAFGAMGMFIFSFSSSVLYLCYHKHHDEEHAIIAQGYMRPQMQAGGTRMSDYQVELPHSVASASSHNPDYSEEVPLVFT